MLDLSFTQNPEWQKKRQIEWDLKYQQLKDEFSKKELEVYRKYFVEGELTSYKDFSVNDLVKILYFPLKSEEAWEYIMQNMMEGKEYPDEPEGYNGLMYAFFHTVSQRMDDSSWTLDEQSRLFHWLLGDEFLEQLKPKVPIGPRKFSPTHILNPTRVFMSAISPIYFWLKDAAQDYTTVWVGKTSYLMSVFPLVDSRVYDLDLHDRSVRTKEGKVIVDTQRKLQYVLRWTNNYIPDEKPVGPIDTHLSFLAEFREKLKALESKPEKLRVLLDKYLA